MLGGGPGRNLEVVAGAPSAWEARQGTARLDLGEGVARAWAQRLDVTFIQRRAVHVQPQVCPCEPVVQGQKSVFEARNLPLSLLQPNNAPRAKVHRLVGGYCSYASDTAFCLKRLDFGARQPSSCRSPPVASVRV